MSVAGLGMIGFSLINIGVFYSLSLLRPSDNNFLLI